MKPAEKLAVEENDAEKVTLFAVGSHLDQKQKQEQEQEQEHATPAGNALPKVVFTPTIYTRYVKTAVDRTIALCALLTFAVPMVFISMLILLSMGSPILFLQRRTGLNGVAFNVIKFRTMGHERRFKDMFVQHESRINHKSDKDPRHTRIGKILRRYSVDELPQLINVIRGEMSIVGPRPELESVVKAKYDENLKQRHLVRPGITGLWQISARGNGPMHENGEWDLQYVEQISFLTDIAIMVKTPLAMFGQNKGQ